MTEAEKNNTETSMERDIGILRRERIGIIIAMIAILLFSGFIALTDMSDADQHRPPTIDNKAVPTP